MKKTLFTLIVILLSVMVYLYIGVYSEGVRAGVLIKISKRGTIFKTYEGQLNIDAFGAIKNKSSINESFDFSVSDDPDLALRIENLAGQKIKLYYQEKYFQFPWLGDTKYLATDVKLVQTSESE